MDQYDEKAKEVLKPFCSHCLPTDAMERVSDFGRECARLAYEDAAKDVALALERDEHDYDGIGYPLTLKADALKATGAGEGKP